jgi:hypothetical protein
MARPIESTPTITGKDAEAVLKRMNEPPTKEDIEFRKKLDKIASKRRVHFSS